MTIVFNIILLLLILGLLINIHELGHFIMAKRAKVHIYEFAFGMGPKLLSRKGKDGIIYSIRAFPIGGFVSMAGEVYDEDDKSIKKADLMCNKSWLSRLSIIVAGVVNNFILALILFFVLSLVWGHTEQKPYIGDAISGYPAATAGIEKGDLVLAVNGKKVSSWDMFILSINLKDKDNSYNIKVQKVNGDIREYQVTPVEEKNDSGQKVKVFGFSASAKEYHGFVNALKYSVTKFGSALESMWVTIISLFTGSLSLSSISGPVGIYQVVGESAKYGISSLIYLTAILSLNLGFINILPIPAFDGGRALFLVIEKIMRKPINRKIENTIHNIFFILLMILMLIITCGDILRFF